MTYRYAYLWIIGLFLITILAFWPTYFSRLAETSWPYHLHGIISTIWIGLFVVQNLAINQMKRKLHRQIGISIMVVVPLFLAAGMMMVNTMTASIDNPFYEIFGDRLAAVDVLTSIAFAWFIYGALANRRNRVLHGGYLLMTMLLLLPPILSRINPLGFLVSSDSSLEAFFSFGFNVSVVLQLILAGILFFRHRNNSAPFVEFAGIAVVQWIVFYWANAIPGWNSIADLIAAAPILLLGLIGLLMGIVAVVLGWRAVKQKPVSMPESMSPPSVPA